MMITKTNKLSTDRLFSTMYPAKNWAPKLDPYAAVNHSPYPTATAI
jgi:hypothetical protein